MDNGREDQLPWTRWFWADWESDIGLRACGLEAQGLWQRMLSIMARAKIKGYLMDGEKQMESKTLAKIVNETKEKTENLVQELFSHGVPSRADDGTIFNRRMVREAVLSQVRSDAGKKGGRPRKQKESKRKANTKLRVKAPSASASASASNEIIKYLNEKAGKHFEADAEITVKCINARISKGRTLEDFMRVIDVKVSQWKGDPKMDSFLRPETLFGTKMESYLNESIISPKISEVEKSRRVGLKGWEDQLTDEARSLLPKIDVEFDEKYPNLEGPDRNDYRKMRLNEIHRGERPLGMTPGYDGKE
jgi:uncharacterized phage protein (TIGR02220 family)